VSQNNLFLTKVNGILTFDVFFQSSFSLLLYTRTFFTTPFAEKMHSLFSISRQSENPFPAFFTHYNFSPFLNECQLFMSKDFETSLLTLLGVSLVL
jgi:hypothetical protein